MRQIKRIFVHCTAGSQRQTIDDLKAEFHRKGWSNPGYHYVIDTNGGVHQLLAIEHVSNGVQGYNSTAINVAYIGGIDADGKPIDNRTPAQKTLLCSYSTSSNKSSQRLRSWATVTSGAQTSPTGARCAHASTLSKNIKTSHKL